MIWPWWDGKMTHHRIQLAGARVVIESKEQEALIAGLMGKMLQIKVLERKDKQAPGREAWLMLYEWMEIKRKGEMVKVAALVPGDVVWWNDEPLKVVSIEPYTRNEKQDEGG